MYTRYRPDLLIKCRPFLKPTQNLSEEYVKTLTTYTCHNYDQQLAHVGTHVPSIPTSIPIEIVARVNTIDLPKLLTL